MEGTMVDPPAKPFHLTARDEAVLNLQDEDYVYLTWEHIKEVIGKPYQRFLRVNG
jgi:hypothetical protein